MSTYAKYHTNCSEARRIEADSYVRSIRVKKDRPRTVGRRIIGITLPSPGTGRRRDKRWNQRGLEIHLHLKYLMFSCLDPIWHRGAVFVSERYTTDTN